MTESFSTQYRIYYEDTDAEGVVYYANYLKFFERARSDWLRYLGFPVENMKNDSGVFMVKRVEIEYISPARLGEQLTINTTILEQRKTQFVLQQIAHNEFGTVCSADIRVVTVNLESGRPTRIPEELNKAIKKWQTQSLR